MTQVKVSSNRRRKGDAPVREGRVPHPDDKVELAVLEAA
jgi:hypothetical protein